ncbi:MAG: helix-turn-helix transcriptional regulator [Emcibacteraceae bacterium]
MELKKRLGGKVSFYRTSIGMTQERLAEELDLSVDMIGKIERGTAAPSFNTLEKLCNVLDKDILELFGDSLQTELKTPKANTLREINSVLIKLNEKDLERALKLLKALT